MNFVKRAQRAVDRPEVQEMIRRLSEHGLGVYVPHLHPWKGGFELLPVDVVQVERDLRVSFVRESEAAVDGAVPIGWRWDGKNARVAASCYCCKGH